MPQHTFNLQGSTLGSELVGLLNNYKDAVLSVHSGVARPLYVVKDTMWMRTVSPTLWQLMVYDGTQDIELLRLNPQEGRIIRHNAVFTGLLQFNSLQAENIAAENADIGQVTATGNANIRKLYQGQERSRAMQVSMVDTLPTAILGSTQHLDATHLLVKETGRVHEISRLEMPIKWKELRTILPKAVLWNGKIEGLRAVRFTDDILHRGSLVTEQEQRKQLAAKMNTLFTLTLADDIDSYAFLIFKFSFGISLIVDTRTIPEFSAGTKVYNIALTGDGPQVFLHDIVVTITYAGIKYSVTGHPLDYVKGNARALVNFPDPQDHSIYLGKDRNDNKKLLLQRTFGSRPTDIFPSVAEIRKFELLEIQGV